MFIYRKEGNFYCIYGNYNFILLIVSFLWWIKNLFWVRINDLALFCKQNRWGPMAIQRKAIQRKEIDWLLLVTVYVVEMVPTNQKTKDGSCMEVKKNPSLSSTMFSSSSFLLISNWTTIFDWIDYDNAIIDQSNAYGKISNLQYNMIIIS